MVSPPVIWVFEFSHVVEFACARIYALFAMPVTDPLIVDDVVEVPLVDTTTGVVRDLVIIH